MRRTAPTPYVSGSHGAVLHKMDSSIPEASTLPPTPSGGQVRDSGPQQIGTHFPTYPLRQGEPQPKQRRRGTPGSQTVLRRKLRSVCPWLLQNGWAKWPRAQPTNGRPPEGVNPGGPPGLSFLVRLLQVRMREQVMIGSCHPPNSEKISMQASPIPDPAPVIITTLSFTLFIGFSVKSQNLKILICIRRTQKDWH